MSLAECREIAENLFHELDMKTNHSTEMSAILRILNETVMIYLITGTTCAELNGGGNDESEN